MNPSSVTQPPLEGSPRKNGSCLNTATNTLLKPSLHCKYKEYWNLTTLRLLSTVNLFLFYSFLRFSVAIKIHGMKVGPLNFRVFQQQLLFSYAGIKVADLMPRRLLFALVLAFSSTGSDSAVLQMRSFPSLQPVAKCPSSAKLQDKTSNTEKIWHRR